MYQVEKNFALHESGTKHYQVFMVRNLNTNKAVQINHYGKYSAGMSLVPRTSGQSEIGSSGPYVQVSNLVNSKIRMKEKRGYKFERCKIEKLDSEVALWQFVNASFTKEQIDHISRIVADSNLLDMKEDDSISIKDFNTPVPKMSTMDMNEDWGSW